MATLILTAVGGVIGGRIGSAVGALVGQVVDNAIFAPAPRQGPRLSDLSVQSSTYGAAIPKIFGRTRVAGTVIWSTDLVETRSTQSNGKGRADTETYSYSASFAVLLSGRRIVRIERIWADGKLLRGAAGDLKVELAALRVHEGDPDQSVDPLIASAEGVDAPGWRGQAYVVFEGLQLADYGNRIPSLSFEVVADEAPVGIGTIVGMLADVASEAGPMVTGFTAAGSSVRSVVDELAAAFFIALRGDDVPALQFAPVLAAPPSGDDFGAHVGDARAATFDAAIDPVEATPAALSIAYLDRSRDYQAGMQRAWRTGGGARAGRIDLPAVLDAEVANTVVYAVLSRAEVERTRASLTLPWRAMTLRPGDAIAAGDTIWRIATVQVEHMVVRLDLVRTSDIVLTDLSVAPGRNTGQTDAPHGPTTLAVIDLPPLADQAQPRATLAVFANGSSPGWRRAALLASVDGGASFVPAGATALPATMGSTVTALASASAALIDRINTIEVELLNETMLLSDADMPSLLGGANLAMIGDELIQFGRAEPTTAGRWRVGELWRGRRGTEDAIAEHPAGSRFVLIDAATAAPLSADVSVAGVSVMAVGVGDVAPYPVASCPNAARSVTPLSPVSLAVAPLEGGDTELRWIRRSREGWAWRDGVDAPLAEEREAYRIEWEGGSSESVVPRVVYTAAMRAADVAAGRSVTNFRVRQVGSGALSPPASIALDI